ncbi:2Fe-2S iron-sulfur cluster-binding protein [Streptomyces hygroscopicus]|uniref:(2Fe-2S)-binding protein n=1 Tax=Streptomyces hygroscopicus TaxID=1912 RepID=UPI003D7C1EB4
MTVNGRPYAADDVWEGESLLYVLRERLGLPGSKNACEQGECGSCTVRLDGVPVCACLVAAGQAEGREVLTVEGLADHARRRSSATAEAAEAAGPGAHGSVLPGEPGEPGDPGESGEPGAARLAGPGAVRPGEPGAAPFAGPEAACPGEPETACPGESGAVRPGEPQAVRPGEPGTAPFAGSGAVRRGAAGAGRHGESVPLAPVQRAFIDAGAVQCGFCTPGLLVAADELLERNPDPSDADIREALSGNLCRCTGYEKILDAVRLAAARTAGEAV